MKNTVKVTMCATILALAACSSDNDGAAKVEEPKPKVSHAEDKPSGVILQHQLDALNKAKGVEDLLKERDQEQRKEIDSK